MKLEKIVDRLVIVLLSGYTLLLLVEGGLSLDWRMVHDSPILFYLGFLMQKLGAVPYRDFFDMNMPGSYVLYGGLGRLFGFSDFGFRLADVAWQLLVLGAVWAWMRPFGRKAAWAAATLFELLYFRGGPGTSLQREALVLPFLAGALLCLPVGAGPRRSVRFFLSGLAAGAALLVKPQAAIILVVLAGSLIADWAKGRRRASGWRGVLGEGGALLAGFLLLPAATALYLVQAGAWQDFLAIAGQYWPLYNDFNGDREILTGFARGWFVLRQMQSLGGWGLWLAPAAVGAYFAFRAAANDDILRRRVALTAASTLVCWLMLVSANKFWDYHWLPFLFFLLQLAAMCFTPVLARGERLFATGVLVAAMLLGLLPATDAVSQMRGMPPPPPGGGQVDEIAAFLKASLGPGDSVQPLDWTAGAVHAMLEARAPLATRFVYDFHFYHHVSTPYIQGLRVEFLRELSAARPRFVIQFTNRSWVSGPDTTRSFPELEAYLARQYEQVVVRKGYVIWERR